MSTQCISTMQNRTGRRREVTIDIPFASLLQLLLFNSCNYILYIDINVVRGVR